MNRLNRILGKAEEKLGKESSEEITWNVTEMKKDKMEAQKQEEVHYFPNAVLNKSTEK